MNYLNYIKYSIYLIIICAAIWFVKDYQDKKQFKEHTEANELWRERLDSIRMAYIVYNDDQMLSHIKEKEEITAILKEHNIKAKRVTAILEYLVKYRDTTIVTTDLSEVLDAIKQNKQIKKPFTDSTSCLVIRGDVEFSNNRLNVNVNERIFMGKTTAVGFWERRQWKFFGIKTRVFGKKQGSVKVVDKCGESQIIQISKSE